MDTQCEEISLYVKNAREMLEAARVMLDNDFYTLFPVEYSQIYGRAMEDRHESDYAMGAAITREDADENLVGAEQFVQEIEQWLKKQNWL